MLIKCKNIGLSASLLVKVLISLHSSGAAWTVSLASLALELALKRVKLRLANSSKCSFNVSRLFIPG